MAKAKTMRHRHRSPILAGAAGLTLGLLACSPVIAIGWEEMLVIFVLGGILLGPVFFRLARRWNAFQKSQKKKKE